MRFRKAFDDTGHNSVLQVEAEFQHFVDIVHRKARDFVTIARHVAKDALVTQGHQGFPDGRFAAFVFFDETFLIEDVPWLVFP